MASPVLRGGGRLVNEEGDIPMTLADKAAFRITWSLFTAIERSDQETIEAIWQETDDDTLLHGWHCVAKRLRQALQQHAERVGCDCGSDEWLELERHHIAADGS
jgi:hypothetical protein